MNLDKLKQINPTVIGKQLQLARQRRGKTQEEAASEIGVARTTITAIEKGERRIKPSELIKLADAYNVSIADLVGESPTTESFDVQFRSVTGKTAQETDDIQKSIGELRDLCRDFVELERIMNAPLPRRYPPQYSIEGLPVSLAAERIAQEERNRLGLGDSPIADARNIFECEVGIRVFFIPIRPSTYSEIYHYDNDLGACMAINILHPEQRRRWSMAHAYAHFIAHRYRPSVSMLDRYRRKPESERFADDFTTFFLLPTGGVLRQFSEIKSARKGFNVGDLFAMAHYYGVAPQSLSLRLEELGLLPNQTWERLKDRGIKVRDVEQEIGLESSEANADMLPSYYKQLAIEALDKGEITEGRFARFLRMDRLTARVAAEELRKLFAGDENSTFVNIDLLRR